MRVLICFESSGVVREAFRAKGHDAWSCDLLPADDESPYHIQGDAIIALNSRSWDMAGMHPPCTYLNSAGLHWVARGRVEKDGRLRADHYRESLDLVRRLMTYGIPYYLENPTGAIGSQIRPANQYIQPYEFAEDASKKTGLWLNRLPHLRKDPAQRFPGRIVIIKGQEVERWSNQTDSGQNKLPPSKNRWKERSRTYPGIARAMAEQWSNL